jgi:beta-glucanase (GH16 family)
MINKKLLLLLLGMIWLGIFGTSCSDDFEDYQVALENYPLNAFSVIVGDSYYHGKIDQSTHRVEIGAIEDPNLITGLDYTLVSDSSTIYPDPSTFIGNWKREQSVTVTTEDNEQTTYTIVLTQYNESTKDVLFMDDFDTDGIPDPEKWVLCKKATSDWNEELSESYNQAYVKDGKLVLVAEKVDGEYQAGGIETNGKFDFTFGKVEVKARITQHPDGAFPAIWMMPRKYIYNSWPNCGEIDIMEHIQQQPYIHQTLHSNYTYNLGIKNPATSKTVNVNYDDWNTYGVEWTEDKITFLVNGTETFSYPNLQLENEAEMQQWPFTKDASFYLILNMGLGGRSNSWAGPIDDNNLPAVMEVDWVKVSNLD